MKVEVDRGLCAGYMNCVELAPGVFDLDDDGIAVVTDSTGASDDVIVAAARACPLRAVRVWADDGAQVVG